MIDEARIECDESGFVLILGGDMVDGMLNYVNGQEATNVVLRLSGAAAEELLEQAKKEIGPWVAERERERVAYERATPEARAAVLGLETDDDDADDDCGYALDDPKHPTYVDRMTG